MKYHGWWFFHGNFAGDLMAYIQTNVYIYIEREREIYREMTKYTYLYIWHIYPLYIYKYSIHTNDPNLVF